MKRILFIMFCLLSALVSPSLKAERPYYNIYKLSARNIVVRQCSFPIVYKINREVPDRQKNLIIRSFEYWDNLTEKNLFEYGGTTHLRAGGPLSRNIIVVGITNEPRTSLTKTWLAYTTRSFYDGSTACITRKGDIKIFRPTIYKLDDVFESIIRHEVGHTLGLLHNLDPEGLMFRTIKDTDIKKELNEWELNAFKWIYR